MCGHLVACVKLAWNLFFFFFLFFVSPLSLIGHRLCFAFRYLVFIDHDEEHHQA